MAKEIFKIQKPLYTTGNDDSTLLVYNKDRSIEFIFNAEKDFIDKVFNENNHKSYVYAEIIDKVFTVDASHDSTLDPAEMEF